MRKLLILSLCALCSATAVSAKSYYVATTGNDANSGSKSAPFKTISKAASVMNAGDECVIRGGVYREVLNAANSGKKGKPITFTNYQDEKVVIDATEELNGWSADGNGVYTAKCDMDLTFEQKTLYYDGKVLDLARWPNNADADPYTYDAHPVEGGTANTMIVKDMPDVDMTGGYFYYLGAHSGTSWSRQITSMEGETLGFAGVNINSWPFTPHNPTILRNGNRGQLFLYGKRELLDIPMEWHYDVESKQVAAMFPGKSAPKSGAVKYAARLNTMILDGDYITIDGIDCFGGMIDVNGDNCVLRGGVYQNCSQSRGDVVNGRASVSYASIRIKGSNIVIEDNLIEYGSSNGITGSGGENILISNNVIRYFDTLGIHAKPISINSLYTRIIRNTIHTTGRDGVTMGAESEMAYNDIYDCMRINNDGGVFYVVGNMSLKNAKLHHNWIHDSYGPGYADGRAAGIYLDNNSKGYEVYNNVVWNVTWGGFYINWYNTDINFYNNTIWNTGASMGRWENHYRIERIALENNVASSPAVDVEADWIGTDVGSANPILDPKSSPFEDVEAGNFMPAQGSPLIDAGVVIDGFSTGFKGKNPDVGAYEFGGERWTAGASWAESVKEK